MPSSKLKANKAISMYSSMRVIISIRSRYYELDLLPTLIVYTQLPMLVLLLLLYWLSV